MIAPKLVHTCLSCSNVGFCPPYATASCRQLLVTHAAARTSPCLQADLTQQVRDKAARAPGKLDGAVELALVVSGKPDAAAVQALKLRQQAEYRCVRVCEGPGGEACGRTAAAAAQTVCR